MSTGIVSAHDLGGRVQVAGSGSGVVGAHRACTLIDPTSSHQCIAEQDHGGPHRCLCGDEWWRNA